MGSVFCRDVGNDDADEVSRGLKDAEHTEEQRVQSDVASEQKTHSLSSVGAPDECSEDPELTKLLRTLPLSGTIHLEEETNFWTLQLQDEWHLSESKILEIAQRIMNDHYQSLKEEAEELGKEWAKLLEYQEVPQFDFIRPPSVSGFHITLGRWAMDNKERPKSLVVGHNVSFELRDLIVELTFRKEPVNLPGQYTDDKGMRYYPVLWVLQRVELTDFELEFKTPPHVSIAVLAPKFKVEDVTKFQDKKKSR